MKGFSTIKKALARLKKAFLFLLNAVSVTAILAAVVALLSVVLTPAGEVPRIAGYSVLRVLTGSMAPALPTNALILVQKADPATLAPGDIISFYSADPSLEGALNTHRVVAVESDATGYRITTQGDANPLPDPYPVIQDALVGRVVGASVMLGRVVAVLANPWAFVLLVLLPLLSMTIYNLYKVIHSAHQVLKAEERAAVEKALADLKNNPPPTHP
ncbi:MAG: signal peptidase I [Gemmiger sp.]|nr:signal peptidase I [Gemmiger sp.]